MKIAVKIVGIRYVNGISNYWSNEDFIELLKMFDFPDADEVSPDELREMLYMSISDFEPDEAAKIILTYKLGNQLKAGQIHTLSHEMTEDKVAEEYPEPEKASLRYSFYSSPLCIANEQPAPPLQPYPFSLSLTGLQPISDSYPGRWYAKTHNHWL